MKPMVPARLLVLAYLCSPSLGSAQTVPSVKAHEVDQLPPIDYSKEPFIVELVHNKVRFEADGKGQRELTLRARIQSESAVRDFGLLAYPFASSFESLDMLYVRVIKPDGSVVETPASDIQELDSAVSRGAPMYSDQREKHVAVKSLSAGDVLEASFRWTIREPIARGHFWSSFSYFRSGICLKEILQLDLPKASAAKVHSSEPKPAVEVNADRRIYTFQTAHLKKAEESKIPAWETNFDGVDPPDIQVSSFTSWEEVAAWFKPLVDAKTVVTPEIQAKAEELAKGLTKDEEKIRVLYDFVSTKFRYIGVDLGAGRYTPHTAADVLANRYGDCKDKHTLLAALLKSLGIPAYPALISSRFRVDSTFPSAELFDHVITVVPKGEALIFLDTTPEVAPYGLLLPNLRGRQALVMPNGSPGKLVRTPSAAPFHCYETVTIDSKIDKEGTLDAKMRLEVRGDREIELRSAYRATPQNRWDELTQFIVNQMGFAGKSSEVSVAHPEDTSRPFVVSFVYHRPEFPDWKNHRISLPMPLLALAELNDEQKASKNALPLGSPFEVTFQTTVKLPTEYSAVLPENISRKTEFAEFSAQYSLENGGILHATLHWQTLASEVPGEKRQQYVELAQSVGDVENRYIPVTGKFVVPRTVPQVLTALLAGRSEATIPTLEKVAASQPDNELALQMLAQAYTKTGRPKDSAALLEKRLSVHPESGQLRIALGEAYLALSETDKAMEQFKKGLDQDPEPIALNNVAYALAAANANLKEAEAYSQQAVTRLSGETLQIRVEDADEEDFQLMPLLASSWDTLGWIKFEMGDIANAEKYVAASWELNQNPVVGEHLVEIYEKQKKLARAAMVCFLAQSAFGHEEVDAKLAEEMRRLHTHLPQRSISPPVELSEMRTVHVSFRAKLQGKSRTAEVVISIDAESKVEVAFKPGAEELANGREALARTKYPQSFPDGTAARIVRKGFFSCSIYTKDCVLIFVPLYDAAVPGG
jgi:tetratricopeptide (TPR) repeat protein